MPTAVKIKTVIAIFLFASIPISLSICYFMYSNMICILASLLSFSIGIYIVYIFLPQWDIDFIKARKGLSNKKTVFLTFDDGPDPRWTNTILDILKKEGIPATFFVVGNKAKQYPDIIKRIFDEGHELGNHTFNHRKLIMHTNEDIINDVIRTSSAIADITGQLPTYFRAPHGFKTRRLKKIMKRLELKLVPWTKGIWDTDGSDCETLIKRFKNSFSEPEILLLHDGSDAKDAKKSTAKALPLIIEKYRSMGYRFAKMKHLF